MGERKRTEGKGNGIKKKRREPEFASSNLYIGSSPLLETTKKWKGKRRMKRGKITGYVFCEKEKKNKLEVQADGSEMKCEERKG